jgi:hypothetical protein
MISLTKYERHLLAAKVYRDKNREKIREKARIIYNRDKERITAHQRAVYHINKNNDSFANKYQGTERQKYQSKYYQTNGRKAYQEAYNNHRDEILERNKKYYQSHKEAINLRKKKKYHLKKYGFFEQKPIEENVTLDISKHKSKGFVTEVTFD